MKRAVLFFFLYFLVVVSCADKSNYSKGIQVIDLSQQMENPEEVPISKFVKSIKFVQLETTDSLLLSGINKLNMFDNYLLIDGHLFDLTGKYIRTIYRKGEGPGEIHTDRTIRIKDNKIYVQDTNDIKIFSLEGKLLDRIKLPAYTYFAIQPLSKDRYVGFKSNFDGKEQTCLEFFNKNTILGTIPYIKRYEATASWFFPGEGKFIETDNNLFLKKLLCDTIYQIDTKKVRLEPAYCIDFGTWASDETVRFSYTSIGEIQQKLFTAMPFVNLLGLGDHYWVFTSIITDMAKEKQAYTTCFYDIQNGTAHNVILKLSENETKGLNERAEYFSERQQGISTTCFFPYAMSEDGRYLIDWREPINDQNPVLIIGTLN